MRSTNILLPGFNRRNPAARGRLQLPLLSEELRAALSGPHVVLFERKVWLWGVQGLGLGISWHLGLGATGLGAM